MHELMCWVETLDSTSCPPAIKDLLLRVHATTPMKGSGPVNAVGVAAKPARLSSAVIVPTVQGRGSPKAGRHARPRR
jgi:hypothetical protein